MQKREKQDTLNLHNIVDYDKTYKNFRIKVPEYFNFGFDVVDEWAKKDRNKIAMIWVNQNGEEKKFTFWDMSTALKPGRQHVHQVRHIER